MLKLEISSRVMYEISPKEIGFLLEDFFEDYYNMKEIC
jgi:hypothetical protein